MTGDRTASPGARLWRDRNFNTFWAAQAFDFLGDSMALILMPLLVLEATGSVSQMGLVAASASVGIAVAGIFSGNLIDRLDRRKLMIACDLGRALLYALIPLSWSLGLLEITLIYPVATGAAVMTGCFLITYSTVTPRLVEKEQLTHANGRLQATIALAYVTGPILAGFGAQFAGPALVILMVVACYALSALVMMQVRMSRERTSLPSTAQITARSGGVASEFLAGVRFLWSHPVLRAVTAIYALFAFVSEAAINLFVYYLDRDLGQDRRTVGLAFGIAALGAVLGGGLTPVLWRKLGFGLSFLGALLLQGVAMGAVGLAPGLIPVILLITAFSLGFTLRNGSTMSLRQQLTPDHLLGRTTAAFWTLAAVTSSVGTTLAARSAESLGVPKVLTAMGVAGVLVGVTGFFTAAQTCAPESRLARGRADL